MYKELKITNFRGIKSLEINDFQRVNLFVGKNNTGKTTILESLFLLTGPSNPELAARINGFRGYSSVNNENYWPSYSYGADNFEPIQLQAELNNPSQKRALIIRPTSTQQSYKIDPQKSETVSSSNSLEQSVNFNGLSYEYHFVKGKEGVGEKFVSSITWETSANEVSLQVTTDKEKSYKEVLKGSFLHTKNSHVDLGLRFSNIQIKKQVDKVIKVMRQLEPNLINLVLGADGLIYGDIGLKTLLPVNVMGDGFIKILAIILNMLNSQDGILLIDEVENGLYYTSQDILWGVIFDSAYEFNTQIFATTHSIENLRAFSECYSQKYANQDDLRLFRIEKAEDNKIRTVSYDHETLAASIEHGWEFR